MADKLQNPNTFLRSRASIMKAIYKKPKPAREFEGALQHFDLRKTVYHSKLLATSPTTVICDTTERACILYTKIKQFLPDLKRHFTVTGKPNILKNIESKSYNKQRSKNRSSLEAARPRRQPRTPAQYFSSAVHCISVDKSKPHY